MPVDIEKLKQQQAADLAKAELQNTIEASLPLAGGRVTIQHRPCHWVSYDADDLAQALSMAQVFTRIPYAVGKGTFTSFGLLEHLEERTDTHYDHIFVVDGAPFFECYHSAGSYGSAYTDMVFFAEVEHRPLRVSIRIKNCPIRVRTVALNSSPACSSFRKDYPDVPGADIVRWGTGSPEVTSATYWFDSEDTFLSSMGEYLPPSAA